MVAYGVGGLAAVATKRLLEAVWEGSHDHLPPPSPADRRAPWADALIWAVGTGVGMGVTRLLAVRSAAVVWEVATHEVPPDSANS